MKMKALCRISGYGDGGKNRERYDPLRGRFAAVTDLFRPKVQMQYQIFLLALLEFCDWEVDKIV